MVFKLKKRFITVLALFILIQFSDEKNINKKKNMKIFEFRKLQQTTPYTNPNSTVPTTIPPDRKKSHGGLSACGIVAIIIPCVAALLGVGILATLCRAAPGQPVVTQNYIDTSVAQLKPPVQPVIQSPPVVKAPFEAVQPVVQRGNHRQPA